MSVFIPLLGAAGMGQNKDLQIYYNAYCSHDDVLAFAGRLDIDAADLKKTLDMAIHVAAVKVDNTTHSNFHHVIRQEFHSGNNWPTIQLDNYPVIKLLQVRVYSPDYRMFYTLPPDHMVNFNDTGIVAMPMLVNSIGPLLQPGLRGGFGASFNFVSGMGNIEIIYEYGYTSIPDAVRIATAMLAAAHLLRIGELRASQGMRSLSAAGAETENYGHWSDMAREWEAEAFQMLRRYRKIYVAEDNM